jgi:hypothetical protein
MRVRTHMGPLEAPEESSRRLRDLAERAGARAAKLGS